MTYAATVKFLVAMTIMMNPLGSLSIFLQLTDRFSVTHQRKTAIKCGLSITIIMVITLLAINSWICSALPLPLFALLAE